MLKRETRIADVSLQYRNQVLKTYKRDPQVEETAAAKKADNYYNSNNDSLSPEIKFQAQFGEKPFIGIPEKKTLPELFGRVFSFLAICS